MSGERNALRGKDLPLTPSLEEWESLLTIQAFNFRILIFNLSSFIFNLFFHPTPDPLPASGEGRRCSRPFGDAELDEVILS